MDEVTLSNEEELMERFNKQVLKQKFTHAHFFNSYFFGNWGGHLGYKDLFKDTSFDVDKTQLLCHFTSLQGLTTILRNGFVRMSEFSYLSDNNEMYVGTDILKDIETVSNLIPKKIKQLKECCFELSTMLSTEKNIIDPFMWYEYGKNGMGAVIEFELSPCSANQILLGKVLYGKDGYEFLDEIKELVEEFKKEHGIIPNSMVTCLIELLAFLKLEKYRPENEIRLFVRRDKEPHESHNYPFIYQDITPNNEVKHFFKLLLDGRKDVLSISSSNPTEVDEWYFAYPRIIIKRIILGNCLSPEQKVNAIAFFNAIKEKYKYNYSVHFVVADYTISPPS